MTTPLATRTVTQYGIELPWERVERYGPQYNKHLETWSDNPPKGTVLESGTVFIELGVLEELMEADHSFGMGGAYLVGYREGMALEVAGLASQETRGGYFTSDEQRAKLQPLIDSLYDQMEAAKS